MKQCLKRLAFCLIVLVPFRAEAASSYEEAAAAHASGNFSKTLDILRPLADQGDATAQADLGHFYVEGMGVGQNYAEAAKWYRKAGEQGHENAQYQLAMILASGFEVPRDDNEAARWLQKSAEQGYAPAQYMLAVMYATGRGVNKDPIRAYVWSALAAQQKNREAVNHEALASAERAMTDEDRKNARVELARQCPTCDITKP